MPAPSSSTGKPVAVLTASTAGIGLSSAHTLASRGYHVIISSRSPGKVASAVASINSTFGADSASGIPCHVSKPADRLSLLSHVRQRTSSIKALILNAAVSTSFGSTLDVTEKQWDKMFDVNVKAPFLLIKLFRPLLHYGSSVVLVSSIAAYNPMKGLGVYSVTKTALLGLCKVLAKELAEKGIRVNGVAPGIIQTRFSKVLWEDGDGNKRDLEGIPMGRIGQADEVARVIAFLASNESSYICGETIVIAGAVQSKL